MKQAEFKLLEKIFIALKTHKSKFVTAEMIAQTIGILPEKIQEICATFNPLITIDYSYDLKQIIPDIEAFLTTKSKMTKKNQTKKQVSNYERVIDFVYDKMTFNGIVDRSAVLSDADLREIKFIAMNELKIRRANKKKK